MRRASPLDFLLLLLLACIWGSSFTIIKVVVPHLPPFSLTLWRVALAAVALLAAAWWRGEHLRFSAAAWGWITLAGITGNSAPFTLISWGEERVDSGLAAILISITPFVVLLLAHFLIGEERLTARRVAGVALGFAGVVVLIGPASLAQVGEDAARQLAVAGAAVCYALNTLMVRHLQLWHMGPQNGPLALAAGIMLTSVLTLAPVALLAEGIVIPPAKSALLAALLGVVHTALATLVMFAIIRRAGATFFATINFLIPVVGYLLGVLVLGEPLSWRALAALALVLAGLYAVSGTSRSSIEERAAPHSG